MPRNGDGSSDNGPFPEAGHDILHGAEPEVFIDPQKIRVCDFHSCFRTPSQFAPLRVSQCLITSQEERLRV
jgi:hypothetical protein